MTTIPCRPATADFPPILTWAPVLLGLAVMYIPSFVDLFKGIWSTPEQGHGPMVLGVAIFLLYRQPKTGGYHAKVGTGGTAA